MVRGLTKTLLMHIELPYYNGPGFFPLLDAPACNIIRIRIICGRAHAFGVTLKVDLIYTTSLVVSLSLKRDKSTTGMDRICNINHYSPCAEDWRESSQACRGPRLGKN